VNFIRKVNLKNWHDLEALKKDLAEGETPADPVCSFNTRECRMSVFALDKTERAARVAAAIVCRAQNLQGTVGGGPPRRIAPDPQLL